MTDIVEQLREQSSSAFNRNWELCLKAADEIEQLRAERDAFCMEYRKACSDEIDALKKDAERYRWLRKNRYMSKYPNSEFDHAMHLSFTVSGVWVNNADPDVLDECIDKAMLATAPKFGEKE